MRTLRSALMSLSLVLSTLPAGAQHVEGLHVTKVVSYPTDEGEPTPAGDAIAVARWKVWGYTDTTEYVLACTELQKEGKPRLACMPMTAGRTYTVKVFEPTAISFPAEQPNVPDYAWYMIRQEQERSKK
jgi:hypothetical protein